MIKAKFGKKEYTIGKQWHAKLAPVNEGNG